MDGNGAYGKNSATPGNKGEDCGIVTISNSVLVEAYGGTGGSGGGVTLNVNPSTGELDVQSGGGGGGYPAAGIGGGGCGGGTGDTWRSGGGFGNGTGEFANVPLGGVDGKSFNAEQVASINIGGAYYESYANTSCGQNDIVTVRKHFANDYSDRCYL